MRYIFFKYILRKIEREREREREKDKMVEGGGEK